MSNTLELVKHMTTRINPDSLRQLHPNRSWSDATHLVRVWACLQW